MPQFGFRGKSATTDAVFTVRALLGFSKKILRKTSYAIFVDIKKCFPSVKRSALFDRLLFLGFSEKFVKSLSSFYSHNEAKLRIGVLLTALFLVNTGLSEGRVLSPPLFTLVFSIIWEKLETADFPTKDYVFSFGSFWIIGFADDIVIIGFSKATLNNVLDRLISILSIFDMSVSEEKTEVVSFQPSGRASSGPSGLKVGDVDLKLVNMFKYLGVWLSADLKFGHHLTVVEERARLASLETANLLRLLEVRSLSRLKLYYRCFVESQFYGVELFPVEAEKRIHRTRTCFLSGIFKLTKSFPSAVTNFILDLYPAVVCLLKAQASIFRRLKNHEIPFARLALDLCETELLKRHTGWSFDSFIIYRRVNPNAKIVTFSFERDVLSFVENFPSSADLSWLILHEKSKNDPRLLFFKRLNIVNAKTLRSALDKISVEHVRIVLLFVTSELRFRLCRVLLTKCPFCPSIELLYRHYFECPRVLEKLSSAYISLSLLEYYVDHAEWKKVFRLLGDLLMIWADVLESYGLDIDEIKALSEI